MISILRLDWIEEWGKKQNERDLFSHWQNKLRAKFNWMTINSSSERRRKKTHKRTRKKWASEQACEPTTMVPEFSEGRSMNASAHVYHVTICFCSSVRPSVWVRVCVCVSAFFFSFIFSIQWFHISHRRRSERERDGGKCWARWMPTRWVEKKEKIWVDQKDWRWWLAMNSNWLAVSHVCACASALSAYICQILGSFISILYRVFFFFSSRIFCVFTEKNSFFCVVCVKLRLHNTTNSKTDLSQAY